MEDLPPFKRRKRDDVLAFITAMLINEHSDSSEESHFIELVDYEDGHFRVLFNPRYFVVREGQTEPTKSQWNSLKKKLKRHDSSVFVFKEYGAAGANKSQYYLDFGFLPERPSAIRKPL